MVRDPSTNRVKEDSENEEESEDENEMNVDDEENNDEKEMEKVIKEEMNEEESENEIDAEKEKVIKKEMNVEDEKNNEENDISNNVNGNFITHNEGCICCRRMINGVCKYTSTVTGESYKIDGYYMCNTSNCIYLVTCTICDAQYVGKTTTSMRERHKDHRNNIKNNQCGLKKWELIWILTWKRLCNISNYVLLHLLINAP